MSDQLKALEAITGIMLKANVAIPIVFGAVHAIASIIKGVIGNGPTLSELADMIAAQVDANDAKGRAEIERLKALL